MIPTFTISPAAIFSRAYSTYSKGISIEINDLLSTLPFVNNSKAIWNSGIADSHGLEPQTHGQAVI